jgi:hypothetical protein
VSLRKNKKLTTIIATSIITTVTVSAGVGIFANKYYSSKLLAEKNSYESKMLTQQSQIDTFKKNSITAWVLKAPKLAGDIIMDTDLKSLLIPKSYAPSDTLIDKKDIVGKSIKISAEANTPFYKNTVFQDGPLDSTLRRVEIQFATLPTRLTAKDTLDVLIVFPDGESFVVLSKKKLVDYDPSNLTIYTNLTAEESSLLEGAMADAYYNKAEVYTQQYVDPTVQDASIVTYTPPKSILNLMSLDYNIQDKAKWSSKQLERQLIDANQATIKDTDKKRILPSAPEGSFAAERLKILKTSINVPGATGTSSTTNATPPTTMVGTSETTVQTPGPTTKQTVPPTDPNSKNLLNGG